MPSFTEHRPPSARRGSVLIAVLALLFLASVAVFRFVEEAAHELQYRGQVQDDEELRLAAYSALETTFAVLAEFRALDGKLASPVQGWSDPLAYAAFNPPEGISARVLFTDESGKIPLSRLDADLLPIFFEEMGLAFAEAQELSDTLLDWQDEDDLARLNGAESDLYEREDVPYRAANRPLRSWEELRRIEGFRDLFFAEDGTPNAWFDLFTGSVTLLSSGSTNLNAANDLTLRFIGRLEGFDPANLQDYLRGEDDLPGTADDLLLFNDNNPYYQPDPQASLNLGALETSLLRIDVECRRGETFLLLEAFVALDPAAAEGTGFRLRSLRENERLE